MKPETSSFKYYHVMIVDDSKSDLAYHKKILESMNYAREIIAYDDPEEALNYIRDRIDNVGENKIPDIILLDLDMPNMSGFDFIEEFDQFPKLLISKTKFIVVSASEDYEDIERSAQYPNVIKYIIKPLKKLDLLIDELENKALDPGDSNEDLLTFSYEE